MRDLSEHFISTYIARRLDKANSRTRKEGSHFVETYILYGRSWILELCRIQQYETITRNQLLLK